jgi:hypothetical protein
MEQEPLGVAHAGRHVGQRGVEPSGFEPPDDAVDVARQHQEQHQYDGADRRRHDAE